MDSCDPCGDSLALQLCADEDVAAPARSVYTVAVAVLLPSPAGIVLRQQQHAGPGHCRSAAAIRPRILRRFCVGRCV